MTFREALGAFLSRYGLFLAIGTLAIVLSVRQARRWWKRNAEILDPRLVPEWTGRRVSLLPWRARGSWLGRRVSLRKFPSSSRSEDALEATLDVGAPGRFILERAGASAWQRTVRVGAPPRLALMNPRDESEFRVRSDDRTAPERLLASPAARAAILECLRAPVDEISLRRGRLRVFRRFSRTEAAAPLVAQSMNALKEMAGVLG